MILRGIVILGLALVAIGASAQRKRDQKVYSYQPDLEYSYNMSLDKDKGVPKANLYRDDLLYHSESAYVTPDDRGNYSLLKYSRFGIGHGMEISTNIGEDAFRPIVGVKREWGQWGKLNILSSSVTLSTFYPGYKIAQNAGMDKIVEPWRNIRLTMELGHEFIFSHIWSSDPNCSTGNPYMVMSFGLGTYWGINTTDTVMTPMKYHLLAQRSTTYGDSGFRMHLKGWVDGYINSWLTIHGGLWVQYAPVLKHRLSLEPMTESKPKSKSETEPEPETGTFLQDVLLVRCTQKVKHQVSLEARVEAEAFLTPRLSVTLGVLGSLGKFEGVKTLAMGYPMVDISFYFGKKKSMSGLFDLKL